MQNGSDAALMTPASPDDVMDLRAVDVTGTHEARAADVQRGMPAGELAHTLAARMTLPLSVPWTLHNTQGAFLDDRRPIGEQVEPGETVTLSPKTHLG